MKRVQIEAKILITLDTQEDVSIEDFMNDLYIDNGETGYIDVTDVKTLDYEIITKGEK